MNILLFRIVQRYLILEDQYNGLREDVLIPVYLSTIVKNHTYWWLVEWVPMILGCLILIKEYGNNW